MKDSDTLLLSPDSLLSVLGETEDKERLSDLVSLLQRIDSEKNCNNL